MSEQAPAGQGNQQALPEVPIGWISQVSDEELRRQELTWAYSEVNKNSPEGKILIPLLQAEMQKRGVKPFNLNPDDPEHFTELVAKIIKDGTPSQ